MSEYGFNFPKILATFSNTNYFDRPKKITPRSKIYPGKLVIGILTEPKKYLKSLKGDDLNYLLNFFKIPITEVDEQRRELVKQILLFIRESFVQPLRGNPDIENNMYIDKKNLLKEILEGGSNWFYLMNLFPVGSYPWVIKYFYEKLANLNLKSLCVNTTDMLSQEEIQDIDEKSLVRIWNGNCFDIDYLVEYLISNNNLNRDPTKTSDQLWKNEDERLNIINHKGLDKDTKKRYENMLKEIEKEEKKFIENLVENEDRVKFLNLIPLLGTICLNDETFSFSNNENGLEFIKSQKAIEKFLSILNGRNDKEIWLNLKIYGKTLNDIIKIIKDTCIHGIGRMFIDYYISIYYFITQKYKKELELSRYVIKINDHKYISHQIISKNIKRKPQSYGNLFRFVVSDVTNSNIKTDIVRIEININGVFSPIISPDLASIRSFSDPTSLANIWIKFNDNYYESINTEF